MPKNAVVKTAQEILSGQLHPILGCRCIVRDSWGISEEERADADFQVFVTMERLYDEMPLGESRDRWNSDALAAYEKTHGLDKNFEADRSSIMHACREIIRKWSE